MEINNNILIAREKKYQFIKQFINNYQVITLKANIVGENKKIKEAYILLSYFDIKINKHCINKYIFDDYDGPMIIYLCQKNKCLKETMVLYEENDELGRFVDIDVYFNDSKSISRNTLRKCYLCDNYAFVCGRVRNHTVEQLNNYLCEQTLTYLLKHLEQAIDESIMAELNLHPKFGLVTPYTNGSHKDMNYNLMIKAKEAIIPYFKKMFLVGYNSNDLSNIFTNIKLIGIEAEQAMLKETNGVNAYKGLIFALGLIVASLSIKLSNIKEKTTYFKYSSLMTKDILKEYNEGEQTSGKIAFNQYQLKGARHQAYFGFKDVQMIINKYSLEDDQSKIKALCDLIINIDDTVLFKRCNYDYQKYINVKNMFKQYLDNKLDINELNKYCIDDNLSFGGSADLLIVSVFVKKINKIFNVDLFMKSIDDII